MWANIKGRVIVIPMQFNSKTWLCITSNNEYWALFEHYCQTLPLCTLCCYHATDYFSGKVGKLQMWSSSSCESRRLKWKPEKFITTYTSQPGNAILCYGAQRKTESKLLCCNSELYTLSFRRHPNITFQNFTVSTVCNS